MITIKDPSPTVYPNRQQMLALIQARGTAEHRTDGTGERRSAEPEPPWPNCIAVLE